ncbi:AraC family transcriptional regulator [Ancylobacter aquaticus]|uniref:AraC family transcriptional regulator n=1 Tax=Ancylobacter aquaticus TaxID=100 RepID=A0A4R1I463_ANCAQ|nr:AraC family transcriptional regulator [Ancylobacter aquaticus]TCK28150.1 AraC family transcriptional regulator [Ancylobacter aquaticus]
MPSSLFDAITAYVESQGGGQGLFPTPMPGVNIIRSFQEVMPNRKIYQPSLCIVLQGAKQILFGSETLDYGAMECLVVSIELPGSGRIIKASADEPFVGMTVDLDVAVVRGMVEQLEELPSSPGGGPCAFVTQVDEALADCIHRLMRMSDNPKAIPILYPSVMRDICYWLLSGPQGAEICRLSLPASNTERVAKAIHLLRDNIAQPMRVEQLAEAARMSPSSFHQHFKALTSMTPLQYQKQLRLLEARRLMVANAASVADASYKVGYESASQFSREYSRMFGVAPKRDVMNQHRLYRSLTGRDMPAHSTASMGPAAPPA